MKEFDKIIKNKNFSYNTSDELLNVNQIINVNNKEFALKVEHFNDVENYENGIMVKTKASYAENMVLYKFVNNDGQVVFNSLVSPSEAFEYKIYDKGIVVIKSKKQTYGNKIILTPKMYEFHSYENNIQKTNNKAYFEDAILKTVKSKNDVLEF